MTALLDVRDLAVRFRSAAFSLPFVSRGRFAAQFINAVNGVSITLQRGETLGIVGESGCGKSTLGRAILNLVEFQGGEVAFDGQRIDPDDRAAVARLRRQTAMVFQDPYAALNPRLKIGEAIAEVLQVHRIVPPDRIPARVTELLELVGLSPEMQDRLPRQLSGGQCQRVGIARALAVEPRLIVADECVAALDVSIQAQILNLLDDLKRQMNLALIFISHDLGVVRHLCSNVAVMYLGRIVEYGKAADVFQAPQHPYTRALLSAVPDIDPDRMLAPANLRGEPPSRCAFHPRCPHAAETCAMSAPPQLRAIGRTLTACHFDLPPQATSEAREG